MDIPGREIKMSWILSFILGFPVFVTDLELIVHLTLSLWIRTNLTSFTFKRSFSNWGTNCFNLPPGMYIVLNIVDKDTISHRSRP